MGEFIKIIDNTDEILKLTDKGVKAALTAIGISAEAHAKAYETAVDTGRLRNSITHELEGENTIVIGTHVEYAPFIEYGTSKGITGIHYLKRALENHTTEYEQIIADVLGKLV